MPRFANLKLGAKFNLIMSLLLISLFLAAAILTYKREQSLVNRVAIDNARSIARQIVETRDYMSSVVKGEPDNNYNLVPQVVATNVAKRMTAGSDYYVRQVSLRNRNPNNRPDDFETAQLKLFAAKTTLETSSIVAQKGREVFRYMLAMTAEKSCLECHSTPAAAPPEMIALYGTANGFGWKEDEVIAAQIVSVPVSVTVAMADRAFRQLATSVAIVAAVTLVLLNLVLVLTVIRPVSRFAAMADEISKGNMDVPELPVGGHDEISVLGEAFNRMRRSLAAAMKLLEK